MKKLTLLIFLSFSLLYSCQPKTNINNIVLNDFSGNFTKLDEILNPVCSVIIFFSPECPLSENYTLTTNDLYQKYKSDSISFTGIIPGTLYTNEEISIFRTKYNLQFSMYLDSEKELTKHLGASITPECFVLNKDKKIVYHGAIDNWAIDLGKKRNLATAHYLDDAIQYVLNDKLLNETFVEAVGCYIE